MKEIFKNWFVVNQEQITQALEWFGVIVFLAVFTTVIFTVLISLI